MPSKPRIICNVQYAEHITVSKFCFISLTNKIMIQVKQNHKGSDVSTLQLSLLVLAGQLVLNWFSIYTNVLSLPKKFLPPYNLLDSHEDSMNDSDQL